MKCFSRFISFAMQNILQVRQILERHLLVGNEFSIANLTEQGRDNYLQTIRGKVKITIVESGGGRHFFF